MPSNSLSSIALRPTTSWKSRARRSPSLCFEGDWGHNRDGLNAREAYAEVYSTLQHPIRSSDHCAISPWLPVAAVAIELPWHANAKGKNTLPSPLLAPLGYYQARLVLYGHLRLSTCSQSHSISPQ